MLEGKLEDWIVNICKYERVKLGNFGLPEKPNDLHDIINQQINKFEDLIEHLLKNKSAGILQLKSWLS